MSKQWLERYREGEHVAVWAELDALGPQVRGTVHEREVWLVALETMSRARRNVETLVRALTAGGYEFVDPATSNCPRVPHVPPTADSPKFVEWIERLLGPLPISVACWITTVGDVNLVGNHPDWPEPDLYTDALVVEFELKGYAHRGKGWDAKTYVQDELTCWKDEVAEYGLDEVGSFKLPFAPDALHKVNVSGGSPYSVYLPSPSADGRCYMDGNEVSFVSYLRECFCWGGFPGVRRIPKLSDAPTVKQLSDALLPL